MPNAITLPARTPSTSASGPLDVLGEDVAAADDDHVLDAAAHHQLAVEQVGEVAGAQPAVVGTTLGVGVGSLVVAGRHRRAADLQLADLAVLEHVAGDRVDDADLEPGTGRPSIASAGAPARVGVDRRRRSARSRAPGDRRESVRRPASGSGNVPAMATSAMPKAGNTAPGRRPWRLAGVDERLDGVGVDGLGAVERDAQRRQVERLAAPQGAGGEHVGEVRAGGGRAAVGATSTPSSGSGCP